MVFDNLMSFTISIHALRMEGDQQGYRKTHSATDFYPRPPHGGRQHQRPTMHAKGKFLSTPSAWRATNRDIAKHIQRLISIHALRMEGDSISGQRCTQRANFYPRPPHGGRRPHSLSLTEPQLFLSTPSAWRATTWPLPRSRSSCNFYPRPPHGGRPEPAASLLSSA